MSTETTVSATLPLVSRRRGGGGGTSVRQRPQNFSVGSSALGCQRASDVRDGGGDGDSRRGAGWGGRRGADGRDGRRYGSSRSGSARCPLVRPAVTRPAFAGVRPPAR